MSSEIARLRTEYHSFIRANIIRVSSGGVLGNGYPNFADKSSRTSVNVAWGIYKRLAVITSSEVTTVSSQTRGDRFEDATCAFLQASFALLEHIRPGRWHYGIGQTIAGFDQYRHLAYLSDALNRDKKLKTMLGASGDYIVTPDIVVARFPVMDEEINRNTNVIDDDPSVATYTRLRAQNNPVTPMLHASISCKWTIRSDRTQNTRTEALNLIRNRKGHLPHIVAVTAEPLPTRIAAIALGTGDLDCVYHFALPELKQSLLELDNEDQLDIFNLMVDGMRLRDVSDLPFDLAV
ncbi:MAG TPA: restriction endonuclease [Chloroflexi bacterium]|nr:restriction endonuclease [Chloroflexota bacterium]